MVTDERRNVILLEALELHVSHLQDTVATGGDDERTRARLVEAEELLEAMRLAALVTVVVPVPAEEVEVPSEPVGWIDYDKIILTQVDTTGYRHTVSDNRKPTKYEVRHEGQLLGFVFSQSRESWNKSKNGRIRTRMRGYERGWGASEADTGRDLVKYRYTRQDAVKALVNHHNNTLLGLR